MDKFDIAVIGAGISGLATAYALARSGAKVVVVDRFGPAAMASGWTLAGVRQSGRHPAELPLAMEAVTAWVTLHEELGSPTHYRRNGNLRLARNAAEREHMRQMVSDQKDLGLDLAFLDGNAAVRDIASAISPEIPAASFCSTDGHADPRATAAAYITALERLGATLPMGEAVEAINVTSGKVDGITTSTRKLAADGVVLAAGVMGNELLNPLGVAVPIQKPMVTVIRTVPIAPVLDQVIGVAGGDWAGRQESNGRLRITSGAFERDAPIEIRQTPQGPRPIIQPPLSSLQEVIEKLGRLLPGLDSTPIEQCWAGILDVTPDALPVLDHVPSVEGLVVGMGFSGHGFCLGPVTGRVLCDLVSGRPPSHDLSAFKFDRFSAIPATSVLALHG